MNNHPKNFYYQPSQFQQPFTPEALYYNGAEIGEMETLQAELDNINAILKDPNLRDETRLELEDERTTIQKKLATLQNTQFRQKGMTVLSFMSALGAGAYAFHKSQCPIVTALSAYGAFCGSSHLFKQEKANG